MVSFSALLTILGALAPCPEKTLPETDPEHVLWYDSPASAWAVSYTHLTLPTILLV